MKNKLLNLMALCGAVLLVTDAKGNAIWTGAASDGNLYTAGNWSGTAPVGGVTYAGNLSITGATITSATGNLTLADGYSLAITNSTISLTITIQGIVGGSANLVTINHSSVSLASVGTGIAAKLTANSTLSLSGGNRPINSSIETSSVTLDVGSKFVSTAGSADPAGTTPNSGTDRSGGLSIFHGITGQSYAADTLTPPLTDFRVTGSDLTPFGPLGGGNGVNGGTFTITAIPEPEPQVLVGYRGIGSYPANPGDTGPLWYPTARTLTDWQYDIDYPNVVQYGWSAITDFYLADLNGDGISDKVMRQQQVSSGPAQVIVSYSLSTPTGFTTTAVETGTANGDIQYPFPWLNSSDISLVFGDLDRDGIDDCGFTIEGSKVGYPANSLVWGAFKSGGVSGISHDAGGLANFTGYSIFGDVSLGDMGLMGDINGDGVADRIIYRTSTGSVFINFGNPAGGYGSGSVDIALNGFAVAGDKLYVTDINGDGYADLVLARDTSATTPGLQTIYGFYSHGTTISATPDIIDFWDVNSGILFGKPVPGVLKITKVLSAGPNIDFSFKFSVPRNSTYTVQASLDLVTWKTVHTASGTGTIDDVVTKAELDAPGIFGSAARTQTFIRVIKP